MRVVSKRNAVGGLLMMVVLVQGCATTMTADSISDTNPLGTSSYVSDSGSKVVLHSSNNCVRTISWTAESNVVECSSSAAAPEAPVETMVSYNGRALFEFDSATLTNAGQQELNQLTSKLNNQTAIKQIAIVGHADSIGNTSYNQSLSEQRAETVKSYLQQSLNTVSVTAQGMGEDSPVADNATDDGRRLNRRVDVNIAASLLR